MNRLLWAEPLLRCRFDVHYYSAIFARQEMPVGTLVFTDFDHLHTYEVDAAAVAARAVLDVAPDAKVLNRPERALQRTALLARLKAQGLSDIDVLHVDTGELPKSFPVFIRQEDGCAGPETPLLHTRQDYIAALAQLTATGRTHKGRIAVSFAAEPDPDGLYRKYGAFVVGRHVVPQHIIHSDQWIVKSRGKHTNSTLIEEELAYIKENPHADALLKCAEAAQIDFGRIDYGFHEGRLAVYEINTNPSFPTFYGGDAEREERRVIIADRLSQAFGEIDSPPTRRVVRFDDSQVSNGAFIERDSWLRHPHVTLRRKERWIGMLRRIRLGAFVDPKRRAVAIRKRWSNLVFRLTANRQVPGRKGSR